MNSFTSDYKPIKAKKSPPHICQHHQLRFYVDMVLVVIEPHSRFETALLNAYGMRIVNLPSRDIYLDLNTFVKRPVFCFDEY